LKLLVLGKNGQLGWELQRSLAVLGEVLALDRHSQPSGGDLADLEGLSKTIRSFRPDVIVNAAAYTAVDKAEAEPEMAQAINGAAPGALAQLALELGALLVHYSTDYVFDGSGSKPWSEADLPGPLSVYGQTKLSGERLIQSSDCQHLIFRTSWVYAARGGNFAKTMLRLAQERDQLNVIDDQFGAPTGADFLADATAHCILNLLRHPENSGLYHLAAGGQTTWFEYANYVLAQSIHASPAIKIVAKTVRPVTSAEFPTAAKRPGNSRLCTDKFQRTFGLHIAHWQLGVARMLAEIL
jgi:dTDP-4-dehydrorhamnose reductase